MSVDLSELKSLFDKSTIFCTIKSKNIPGSPIQTSGNEIFFFKITNYIACHKVFITFELKIQKFVQKL